MHTRVFLSLCIALAAAAPADACPFCSATGQTLLSEAKQADMILFGTLSNARRDPGSFTTGQTDLTVEVVIKDHDIRAGKSTLTIPRYIPPDPKEQTKYLVFCEIFGGKLDPYRGLAVGPESHMAEYLKGAIEVKDRPAEKRLAYFYNYLNDPDSGIANDALTEFGNSDYKDTRGLYETIDPDPLLGWLKNDPPASRVGLYGSILGHCGKPEHAEALRDLLDEAKGKRRFTGIDGLLAGYVMLRPEEGWTYLRGILDDPKQEFLLRYAALRAVRFFWEYRPDVKSHDETVAAVTLLLDQNDIADLPIEDLRKWERWDVADQVLGLYEKESHEIPIIQRSILKYALSMPKGNEKAEALITKAKAEDAERVADVQDLLELEREARASNQESQSGGN